MSTQVQLLPLRRTLRLRSLQNYLARAIEFVASSLERRPAIFLGVVLALFSALALEESHNSLLTHDEIFTVHISQAPTIGRMLWLARQIDLHPPLHYLLQRESLRLPFPRWFDSRLPSILAGIATYLALFTFTRRRLGSLFAFVALAVFFFGPSLEYAWQNRPYMLWYGLLACLMVAWDNATRPDRSWRSVIAVSLTSLALACTHLFGLACLLPFACAEAVRYYRRRRTDWPLWLAIITPTPVFLGYLYQLRHLGSNSFPTSHLPSLFFTTHMYFATVFDLFYVFGTCALIVFLLPRKPEPNVRSLQSQPTAPAPGRLSPEDLTLLLSLIALPIPLLLAGAVVHIQFWARYGFFIVVPVAVLVAWGVSRTRNPRAFATLAALTLIPGALDRMSTDSHIAGWSGAAFHQTGLPPLYLQQLNPQIPIVTASPMMFIEMADRESPALASRVFYLTDLHDALTYSGYTLFDNEEKIRRLLDLPTKTSKLTPFLAAHRQFYLIAYYESEQDWLARALTARGARLDYLGKWASTYDYNDIFLVTSPENPAGQQPHAASQPSAAAAPTAN